MKIVGLKMVKIQGSDGRRDKRKTAFLNIDSILNLIILGLRKCLIFKAKMGLYGKIG
jgi:hypothetical protein